MSARSDSRPRIQPTQRSEELLERARHLFPGGVNSPSRAFRAVADVPRFIARAEGAYLEDVDRNRYIDLMMARGPILLGHAEPSVAEAIGRAIRRGTTFDTPSEDELLLGEKVASWVPSIEKLRFVPSAGEAVACAVRLARAFTGRHGVVKIEGMYPEDGDGDGAFRDCWALPYNDVEALGAFFKRHPGDVAAMIVEPVASSFGVAAPEVGYLKSLREATLRHGTLLIFDEVATGFRLERGGAQEFYGVLPDLTCLGKVLGGGLPIGACGGRADVMALLAPQGPVHHAGAFAGHPPAMAAGLAVLDALEDERAYAELEARGAQLEAGLLRAAEEAGLPVQVQRVGSMLTLFFSAQPVLDWEAASRCDTRRFAAFARGMYARGVYVPPGQYETMYLSRAHRAEDVDRVCGAALEALREARDA